MTAPTYPVSTVPKAKAYLFGRLENEVVADPQYPLLVCYDEPGPYQPAEIVSIGGARNRTAKPWQMVGSGQAGWLLEEYELEITIAVFHGGDDPQTCYERAYSILGQVETAIRDDPSLGGLVIVAHPAASRDTCSWEPDHKGRLVSIDLTVKIQAGI